MISQKYLSVIQDAPDRATALDWLTDVIVEEDVPLQQARQIARREVAEWAFAQTLEAAGGVE